MWKAVVDNCVIVSKKIKNDTIVLTFITDSNKMYILLK